MASFVALICSVVVAGSRGTRHGYALLEPVAVGVSSTASSNTRQSQHPSHNLSVRECPHRAHRCYSAYPGGGAGRVQPAVVGLSSDLNSTRRA